MSDPVDCKALFLKAEEERRQEKTLRDKAEEERKQEQERNRQTTFEESIQHCHDLLSKPLKAANTAQSTTGKIPPPTGKSCPLRLEPWTDCAIRQQEIYNLNVRTVILAGGTWFITRLSLLSCAV
ncbi:putative mitochondrial chaperone BCS1-B [Penicillium digitatum]|uniref:Putative mitochondrial chaperone BCS1-B n=1 Tax=Penicillium digitatum TaxID=36651 RepID=A0A7T7BKR4_PENDI|nr:putative mitochondrial chaperone BCS1-B [Penicillium digitatum]